MRSGSWEEVVTCRGLATSYVTRDGRDYAALARGSVCFPLTGQDSTYKIFKNYRRVNVLSL